MFAMVNPITKLICSPAYFKISNTACNMVPTKKAKAISFKILRVIFKRLISYANFGVKGNSKILSQKAKAAFALMGIVV
jgi:hypothetical protein